jgi:hypothetical protein
MANPPDPDMPGQLGGPDTAETDLSPNLGEMINPPDPDMPGMANPPEPDMPTGLGGPDT